MGYADSSVVLAKQSCKSTVNEGFGLCIERRGSFIKNENIRLFDKSTSDGNSLFLATGQLCSFGTNIGIQTIRLGEWYVSPGISVIKSINHAGLTYEVADELAVCFAGSSDYLRSCCIRFSIANIFGNGARKQHWLLGNDSYLPSERLCVHGCNILAVDEDLALSWAVETK